MAIKVNELEFENKLLNFWTQTCLDVRFMFSDPSAMLSRIILRSDLENNKGRDIRFSSVERNVEIDLGQFYFSFSTVIFHRNTLYATFVGLML